MTTNHRKVWILLILDKIIAYSHNQSHTHTQKKKKISKIQQWKNFNFLAAKNAKFDDFWQNNGLFMKPNCKKLAGNNNKNKFYCDCHEKQMAFAGFQRNNCVSTWPI